MEKKSTVVYERSDRMQARIDASIAGLEELKLLRENQQSLISNAKSSVDLNRRRRHSVDQGLLQFMKTEMARVKLTKVPEHEEVKTHVVSAGQSNLLSPDPELMKMVTQLSGYSKQTTERRMSLDVNALSINRRHSFVDKTSSKPTINVRNKQETNQPKTQSHTTSNVSPKQKYSADTRRSSVCLGTDLVKSHPSAFARSFTLSGNKFNYPSPMHAVLLQHTEHNKLPVDGIDPEKSLSPERDEYFEKELHNILSQKPPNLNESVVRHPRRHSVSTVPSNGTKDGAKVLSSEFIKSESQSDRCYRKASSSSSDEETGNKSSSLQKAVVPRRRKQRSWFETGMDSPQEKDEIDSETQSDISYICDKNDSAIDSDATLHESNDISVSQNDKTVQSNITRPEVPDRIRRLSYQSEDSGAISGSCMSLITSSSVEPSSSRFQSSSEDGYYSSNSNTPRSRFSYKSDISGFSSGGSSYFAEDELSCDEQVPNYHSQNYCNRFGVPRTHQPQQINNNNIVTQADNTKQERLMRLQKTTNSVPPRSSNTAQVPKHREGKRKEKLVVVYDPNKLEQTKDTFV